MRGKNILWIPLIAILLCSGMMTNLGFAQVTSTKIMVEPGLTTGLLPGDKFWIEVKIENARNVDAFQFKLGFHTGGSVIMALGPVEDGGFLGPNTIFIGTIFKLAGYVHVAAATFGDAVSGDGTLARIQFVVVDAGESPLELYDTVLLGPDKSELPHQTRDGYYEGPTATLVRAHAERRDMYVGETQNFYSKVKNTGDVPLYVKVRYDMVRADMKPLRIGAGQEFTGFGPAPVVYLYVNEYHPWLEWDWINPGSSLFGEPDGNYAESIVNAAITSAYGFDDITLGPGDVIGNVKLEGYCQYPNGPTDAVDIDTYTTDFAWLGSLYGGYDWDWVRPRWIGTDVSDELPNLLGSDPTPLNGLEVLLYNYMGDADHPMRVDALRLRVELSSLKPVNIPIYVVEPNDVLELPISPWTLTDFDVGKYYVTVTCWYSETGRNWNRSPKTFTFAWWVMEG